VLLVIPTKTFFVWLPYPRTTRPFPSLIILPTLIPLFVPSENVDGDIICTEVMDTSTVVIADTTGTMEDTDSTVVMEAATVGNNIGTVDMENVMVGNICMEAIDISRMAMEDAMVGNKGTEVMVGNKGTEVMVGDRRCSKRG